MNVAFLIGSGASIPADMPSTAAIAGKVRTGEGVARHSKGVYYFGSPPLCHVGLQDEHVPAVVAFVQLLEGERHKYYGDDYLPNYEDTYYLATQIAESESFEHDNPALLSLTQRLIRTKAYRTAVVDRRVVREGKPWKIGSIASETASYIKSIVCSMTSVQPTKTDHLTVIGDAYIDKQICRLDVFTLNHDSVLERYFIDHGLRAVDGFGQQDHGVRYWNPDLYDDPAATLRLYKLHGSANWYKYPADGTDWPTRFVGIPVDGDPDHTKNLQGERQRPVDIHPLILVGTFNKMLEYTLGIFAELFTRFHASITDADVLVTCGYGFGDKGINNRVLEWLCSRPDRRMVVIEPSPDDLKKRARGAVSKSWDDLAQVAKLIVLPQGVESVRWSDVTDAL